MNIKDYFAFTKGEKRGVIVLLSIIVLITVGIQFIKYLRITEFTDFSKFDAEISAFEKELIKQQKEDSLSKIKKNNVVLPTEFFEFNPNEIEDSNWLKLGFAAWQINTINNYKTKGGEFRIKSDVSKIFGISDTLYQLLYPYILLPDEKENKFVDSSKKESRIKYGSKITYFNFNPNTISKEQWGKLGFKDWQIKTIFNYKEKGGSWKTKADVKKIYGLSEVDYNKLEPFISLPDEISKTGTSFSKKDYNITIDINTADTTELIKLKGIGSAFSKRIIKYRESLGGFINIEQLKEVYGFTEELFNQISPNLTPIAIGANINVAKIDLNQTDEEQLKKHPYIGWKLAKPIVAYRKNHGKFKDVSDIKQIHLITDEIYSKIAPYLTVK